MDLNKILNIFRKENTLYSSKICSDCQLAEKYFRDHNINITIKKIEDEKVREELQEKTGRVLVPTIFLKGEKFVGFETNKQEINEVLNITGD